MITTLTGTMAETILTMYLFGSLWDRWTIAFKVTTPMLHILFMSCQLWGSYNFYKMYKKQQRLVAQIEGQVEDIEGQETTVEHKQKKSPNLSVSMVTDSRHSPSRDGSEIELTVPSRRTF
jgi:hypothetical protein